MNSHPQQTEIRRRGRRIELLALDVDGVLTDGRLYFSARGEEMKAFGTQDGHGIKLLLQHGIRVALITGRESEIVERRAENLGIDLLFQNAGDKLQSLDALLAELALDYEAVAYMGDDLPDLPCIRRAGLGVAVANAHPAVIEHAHCTTSFSGGSGAVREVCDWLLRARDIEVLAPYL